MGSEGIKAVELQHPLVVEEKVLEPHQQRAVEEKVALDDKIAKLETFVHGSVHSSLVEDEKKRLVVQLHHMKEYATVLGQRIASFV